MATRPKNSKILNHPDSKTIIRRLTEGVPIRELVDWLDKKYPYSKKLKLTGPTLQKFRKDYLNINGQVLKDIQEAAKEKRLERKQSIVDAKVYNSSAYKDKVNEIADTHLDVARKILQLDNIIESRMEYWFNAIQSNDATPSQADKEMRQYMDRQIDLLKQYKKFVDGIADRAIGGSVNISTMHDQISTIRDVIHEILQEFSPEQAIIFMDKFNRRLMEVDYVPKKADDLDISDLNTIEAEILE